MNWWKMVTGIVIVGALGWVGWYVSRPVPGIKMEDQGREHVTPQAVAEFKYNSNPPTSGQHLPSWVKAGVFEEPQSEGELLHALEHGYVVISYNCNIHLKAQNSKFKTQNYSVNLKTFLSQNIFAHEEDGGEGSPSGGQTTDPSGKTGPYIEGKGFYPEGKYPYEATRSAINESGGCKTLVKQLSEVANKKKLWKLIVVPRPELDTTIALTAWTYIDKFDQFDEKRITRFIDFHRDQGPEKTME